MQASIVLINSTQECTITFGMLSGVVSRLHLHHVIALMDLRV